MNICAHISKDSFERYHENYNLNCFHHLARLYPEHSFILFADNEFHVITNEPACKVLSLPVARNRLQKYILLNYKIPTVLKKYNAGIFIPAANSFCNSCNIIQLPVIQDNEILLSKKRKWKSKNLSALILTSPADEELKKNNYPLVIVRHGMHPDFKPVNEDDKSVVRKKYTEDHEYFYTEISMEGENDLRLILKAFSIFKKWQHSSLKLVVLLQSAIGNPIPDFNLYKYRKDVVFIYDSKIKQQERALIQGTAYACVLKDPLQIIASIKCHVPSIVIERPEEGYGEAVFYAACSEGSIARGMIDIYKNELFRNSLIEAATHLSAEYTWEKAAMDLWPAIQNSIQ